MNPLKPTNVEKTYDEWMLEAFKDFLLVFDVIDVLALNDVRLLHCLDGVLVLRLVLSPADTHVTERT